MGDDTSLPPTAIATARENQGVDAVQAQLCLEKFHVDL
jgi:hypothetical protein